MPRTVYTKQFDTLRERYTTIAGEDPIDYISHPGGGEPVRYVFRDGTVALGAREAAVRLAELLMTREDLEDGR